MRYLYIFYAYSKGYKNLSKSLSLVTILINFLNEYEMVAENFLTITKYTCCQQRQFYAFFITFLHQIKCYGREEDEKENMDG